ncbi:MAG: cytochrome c [Alphaproteobacteria bacterium]
MRTALASAVVAIAAIQPSIADEAGDAARGHEVARRWCAECHAIRRGDGRSTTDAAPPFPAIAAMPSTTRASLLVFLQTPHRQMPNFALSRTDMSDLSAFILSLRGR